MRKIAVAIVLSSLLTLAITPSTGYGCKCAYPPPVWNEFRSSKAVFTGKVITLKDHDKKYGKQVLFEVTKSWKGLNESQVIIVTGQGGGDCGFSFHEGTEYLVYARDGGGFYGEESFMTTTICDRTKEVASAGEDFKLLGNGTVPEKHVDLSNRLNERKLFSPTVLSFSVLGIGFLGAFIAWRVKWRNK